jgi:hypothetical protein
VHCGVDLGYPTEGNEVVLPLVVSSKFDAVRAFHVIDDGKLPAVRADDGHVQLNFVGLDHIHLKVEVSRKAQFMPPWSPEIPSKNTADDASPAGEGLALASGEAYALGA